MPAGVSNESPEERIRLDGPSRSSGTEVDDPSRRRAIEPRDDVASKEDRLIEDGPPSKIFTEVSRGEHVPLLTVSLDLLRESVLGITKRGNPTTAAAVSLQMRRLSNGTFDHRSLGFPKFRDFLHFAASVGAVMVLNPVGSPDVTVLLATQRDENGTSSASVGGVPEVTVRAIRRDFWQAFVDWKSSSSKLYDVRADEILKCASVAEAEARIEEDPGRYYRVRPADQEMQLGWMNGFAAGLDDVVQRDRLMTALNASKPFAEFAAYMRKNAGLRALWRARFHQHVISVITEWLQSNDLAIDIYRVTSDALKAQRSHQADVGSMSKAMRSGTRMYRAPGSYESATADPVRSVQRSEVAVDGLRHRIVRAVSLMPLHELLKLPIPVEYVLRAE